MQGGVQGAGCRVGVGAPGAQVSLGRLETLLQEFEAEGPHRTGVTAMLRHAITIIALTAVIATSPRQLMAGSIAGQVFSLATHQPTFFRAAPILFPKKILSIMIFPEDDQESRRKKGQLLDTLEQVAEEAPWKFGFSERMYKETKYSLEAPLHAIRAAWFYPELSALHHAALLTYDVFKATCRQRGHTFLLHRDLPTHFAQYTRGSREEVEVPGSGLLYSTLEFLVEEEVVRREVRGAEERFHLAKYWRAEEGIVRGLREVLERPPWVLAVDLEDQARFARIHGDREQMAAARSIVGRAVIMVG